MSCLHGNHIDDCDICAEVDAAYESCYKAGKAQRQWVGMTADDWQEIQKQAKYHWEMTTGEYAERISHLVEDKLREKNT